MTGLIYSCHFRRIEPFLVCASVAGYAATVMRVAVWLHSIDHSLVRYALALVFAQIAIQVGLILGLVAARRWGSRRETARTARSRRLEELLARRNSSSEILEMAAQWPEDFLSVIEKALQTLAGPQRRRVAELLEASSPYRQVLREAGGRDPSRAVRAVSLLGAVESPKARAAVVRARKHPAEAVRRAARKAIVTGGEEEARRQVLDGACSLPFWERIVLFQLIPADSTLRDYLAGALTSGDDESILIGLEFVLTQQRPLLFPVPAGLAHSRNVEVRVKFFRALPFLQLEEGIYSVLESGLYDLDWRVRAQAAQACGHLRAEALAWRLLEMCTSFEDPAEAGYAALALAACGGHVLERTA